MQDRALRGSQNFRFMYISYESQLQVTRGKNPVWWIEASKYWCNCMSKVIVKLLNLLNSFWFLGITVTVNFQFSLRVRSHLTKILGEFVHVLPLACHEICVTLRQLFMLLVSYWWITCSVDANTLRVLFDRDSGSSTIGMTPEKRREEQRKEEALHASSLRVPRRCVFSVTSIL